MIFAIGHFFKDLRKAIPIFERQLLLFPVLVVLLASAILVFSGRCAVWQWWLAVGMAVGAPFRNGLRRGVQCAFLFILGLILLKIATSVLVTPGWPDNLEYHLPAIRLLTEGWNPVTMATPEALQAFSGIDNSLMRHLFVLFMAKSCWYFSAVAFFFTHEPLNLLFPLFPFLFLPVLIHVWRLSCGQHWSYRVTGVLVLIGVVAGSVRLIVCWAALVDCVVCLGGVGLLLSMYEVMDGRPWRWYDLLCYSFWMCTAKQTGMASCFVFWSVFAVAMLVKRGKDGLKKLTIAFFAITAMVTLVGFSPYLTSFHHYGHPLYPHLSADEEKYPLCDFNTPQRLRNDDAAAMGHLGHFINAYVSPFLAQTYYKWKLQKPDFAPSCWFWNDGRQEKRSAPTSPRFRFGLCFLTLLLLIWGSRPARLCVLMCWLGLAAFPTYLLGYTRFTPWLFVLALLVLFGVPDGWNGWRRRCMSLCLGLHCICFSLPLALFSGACLVDMSFACRVFLNESDSLETLYVPYVPTEGKLPPPTWDYTEWRAGNLLLLKRRVPEFNNANVKLVELSSETDSILDNYHAFYDGAFFLPVDIDLAQWSMRRRIIATPCRRERLRAYPKFILETYCVTLPKLLSKAKIR